MAKTNQVDIFEQHTNPVTIKEQIRKSENASESDKSDDDNNVSLPAEARKEQA